jgi:hypothetical protein
LQDWPIATDITVEVNFRLRGGGINLHQMGKRNMICLNVRCRILTLCLISVSTPKILQAASNPHGFDMFPPGNQTGKQAATRCSQATPHAARLRPGY